MLSLLHRMLTVLVVTVLCGAGVTVGAQAASATTVGHPSGVRVVYGDRMLTLTWHQTVGATGYRVAYNTRNSLSHAHLTKLSRSTTVVISKLVNNRPYYMWVIAQAGGTKKYSSRIRAVPQAGYPAVMPKVTVTPGTQPNQVRVSWSGLQRATRVVVLAGSNNQESASAFHSAWLSATATSTILTVPNQYRWLIGSGTGNAIYAKVAQYNNLTATKILTARSDKAAYRLSPSNSYGFATPLPITGGTRLKVATYNIQSVAASEPGHPWSVRESRVINNILYNNPDLIGLQEDDAAPSMNYQNRQVAADLAPSGYAMSGDLPANYKYNNDLTDGWLYYKTGVLTRLDGGIVSPRDDLNIDWPSGMTDTRGTWGKFQINATGTIFYALDIHLPAAGPGDIVALRTREAAALSTFIQQKAAGAPIVFVGDFNSAAFRDGYCAPSKLHDLGWYDTASTINRGNGDLQTANSPIGYPTAQPERALNVNTGRIDYIMTKNMGGALAYQNQEVLNRDGTPNLNYQGSDHNLQSAVLLF